MRKICNFLLFLTLIFNFNLKPKTVIAQGDYTGYAKALSNCVLYKTNALDTLQGNELFIVPESYFVFVLEYLSDTTLKVQYGKYVGYINNEKVVHCTFVPIVKTLDNVTCDIKSNAGTQVWSIPSASGNVLTTISAGTKNITYIAACEGIVPAGGRSNMWYFVTYTPEFNSTNVYEGYVYSENVTNLSNIFINTEANPEILEENNLNENVIFISSSMRTILIAVIAIPIIVLILIILYKITKKVLKNTNNNNFNADIAASNYIENEGQSKNEGLKNELSRFKNLSFIKRHSRTNTPSNDYPEFPHYDAEDDWL